MLKAMGVPKLRAQDSGLGGLSLRLGVPFWGPDSLGASTCPLLSGDIHTKKPPRTETLIAIERLKMHTKPPRVRSQWHHFEQRTCQWILCVCVRVAESLFQSGSGCNVDPAPQVLNRLELRSTTALSCLSLPLGSCCGILGMKP